MEYLNIVKILMILLLLSGWTSAQAQSPNGTIVPPAASINVPTGPVDVWTLGAPYWAQGHFEVLRNGIHLDGASASAIQWCDGVIYIQGTTVWWAWGPGWYNTFSATTPCGTPGDISRTFNFSWTAGAIAGNNQPASFKVYRGGSYVGLVVYPTATFNDPVVAPAGTQFCYQVSAINSAGESALTTSTCATL